MEIVIVGDDCALIGGSENAGRRGKWEKRRRYSRE